MDTGSKLTRSKLLASAGKGLGLMVILSPVVRSLFERVQSAGQMVADLSPVEAAKHEDYWSVVQQAFAVSRSNINLNSGWTSPSPKMVTEAFVRYKHQEDATASTMWQMLEPQA